MNDLLNYNLPKCERCGVCCKKWICSFGEKSEQTGLCKYLIIYEDTTTACEHILKGNIYDSDFGRGCPFRSNEELFKIISEEVNML